MRPAAQVYLANGVVRALFERTYWPLLFTLLVTQRGLSPLQLVLLGTVYELAIFLSEIPTGVVADIVSRRLSVIISFVLGGGAYLMSALVEPYWLIIISQILVGIATTFHSGAETAWVTDELGSAQAAERIIIRRGRLVLIVGVVGLLLLGGVAAIASLRVALAVCGIGLIAWGLVLTVVMPEDGFTRTEGEGWAEFFTTLRAGGAQVRSVSPLRILIAVIVVGGIAKEAIDRLDVQRLVDIGLPSGVEEATMVTIIMAARLLFAAALLFVAERRIKGERVVGAMVAFLIGTAVGIALLAQVDVLAIAALGVVLQGGFFAATQPLVAVWANAFAPNQVRATVHSFVGQAESFGEVVGGIALGTIAEVFTVPVAMTVSAVLFVGSALYAATARRVWNSATPAL